jgi:RNA polymerase sigma-70 factor (ECF subfamily)
MDDESFKRQFLPLHPKLYRIAFALLGNAQDAEDILQDAYCKLWDKRKELSMIQNPEAFCVTLVRNRAFDFLRSASCRACVEPTEEFIPDEVSPEKKLIEQEDVMLINQLIDELPENQRQIIRLRGIEGCSSEEIETITGLSALNIRVLLSRARKTIRTKFEKLAGYE